MLKRRKRLGAPPCCEADPANASIPVKRVRMNDGFASGQSAIVGDATYGIGEAPGLESVDQGSHPGIAVAQCSGADRDNGIPILALKRWQVDRPDLLLKRVYEHAGLDS